MGLKKISERFKALGLDSEVQGARIKLIIDGFEVGVTFDAEWKKAAESFYKARQYRFDLDCRALYSNKSAEYLVVRLGPDFFYRVTHEFFDGNQNKVVLSPASKEFVLSYFESDKYEMSFKTVRDRILRRIKARKSHAHLRFGFQDFNFSFHTITYESKRKPHNKKVEDVALDKVKACLFSLAYTKNESWELSYEVKGKPLFYTSSFEDQPSTLEIPSVNYDSSTVAYYKVAKSSQFPSQVFLSYYHILEFHFLRVADEALYSSVCAQLNNPSFNSSYDNVNRLLSTIKRNDATVDEKQMLLGVLRKYVAEEDFIDYVREIEERLGDNIFTAPKQRVLGETFSIELEKGHALSNVSAVIKHIRNSLVHSSDRYSRDDCFLPMSESENVVVKYVPLIQYLAEAVIFSTAKC